MYSFAQRADTTVYDEPLYAHYLSHTKAREYHPGADDIIAAMENDGEKVVADIILGSQPTPVAFFKQMTHHLFELDQSFMSETVNVMLTRHPRDMLPSYAEQVSKPTLRDVGYKMHLDLVEYLRTLGQEPAILDSEATLKNPRGVLQKLCEVIGIPFDAAMLSWQAGARPEDGIWAEYWYDSDDTHAASGHLKGCQRSLFGELCPQPWNNRRRQESFQHLVAGQRSDLFDERARHMRVALFGH